MRLLFSFMPRKGRPSLETGRTPRKFIPAGYYPITHCIKVNNSFHWRKKKKFQLSFIFLHSGLWTENNALLDWLLTSVWILQHCTSIKMSWDLNTSSFFLAEFQKWLRSSGQGLLINWLKQWNTTLNIQERFVTWLGRAIFPTSAAVFQVTDAVLTEYGIWNNNCYWW